MSTSCYSPLSREVRFRSPFVLALDLTVASSLSCVGDFDFSPLSASITGSNERRQRHDCLFRPELRVEMGGGSRGDSVSPCLVQEISIAPIRTQDFAKLWLWDQFECLHRHGDFMARYRDIFQPCLRPLVLLSPLAVLKLRPVSTRLSI
jgi:hypothetical protein